MKRMLRACAALAAAIPVVLLAVRQRPVASGGAPALAPLYAAAGNPAAPALAASLAEAAPASARPTLRYTVTRNDSAEQDETIYEAEGGRAGWLEWFLGQRATPSRSIPPGAIGRAQLHLRTFNDDWSRPRLQSERTNALLAVPTWIALGPATVLLGQTTGLPRSPVIGRVSAIAVHPTNPDVVFAGTAMGGVWKTTNATSASPTWVPLTDGQASLAIGALSIDPVNPSILYAGTGEPSDLYGRGILRSIDGGASWTQFAGGGDPATGGPFVGHSVSRLLIDPSTAGSTTATTVWAATVTGFTNSGTSALAGVNITPRGGVYRSTDSGQTWAPLNVPAGAPESAQMHDLALDPTNPDVLYVGARSFPTASNGGIWRSVNARAATPAFARLTTGLPDTAVTIPAIREISLSIGGAAAHNTLYAALAVSSPSNLWGLYKTTDGGASWAHLEAAHGTCNIAGFNITATVGSFVTDGSWVGRRFILNNQYSGTISSVADSTHLTLADLSGTVTGLTWSAAAYPGFCDGQCFFDMSLAVDPSDAAGNTVYVGGNGARSYSNAGAPLGPSQHWRSDNGGTLWFPVSSGNGVTGGLHADSHAIVFDRTGGSFPRPVLSGDDGGLWRSTNQGVSWTTMNTNLAVATFQSVALHPTDPRIVMGGTQDDGTNMLNAAFAAPPAWFHYQDGDGGQTLIDQSNPSRIYHTRFNQSGNFYGPFLSTDGGAGGPGTATFVGCDSGGSDGNGMNCSDPVSFYIPLAQNPAFAPNVIYLGSNKLYRSSDPQAPGPSVASWTVKSPDLTGGSGVVTAIGVLPTLVGGKEVVYTGASDGTIGASSTVDGAPALATWTKTTAAPLPPRFVTEIEVAASDATGNTAYATFSGFNANTPTRQGHVFKTTNGLSGSPVWTDISGDLPDAPVDCIALDPTTTPNLIYVGTDVGVLQSADGGAHWVALSNGLPNAAVFGLNRNRGTGQIVAATFGRGMFQLVTNGQPDATPPTCGGSAGGTTVFNGTAGDSAVNDTGVATIALQGGSTNLALMTIAYANPGSASWSVGLVNHCQAGSGTVRVTDYGGNSCDTVINLPGDGPSTTITAPASVGANSAGNVASVVDAGVSATYTWGITNGSITGGAGTRAITFSAGAAGPVGLSVTVLNLAGCSGNGSANVAVILPARTFVSVTGNDSNDCSNIATPCRTFGGAITQVASGGEVIVRSTGSYGGTTITQGVTLNVPPGIVAFTGQPIVVAAGSTDVVVLRGLTSKALTPGTGTGIQFSSGGALHVEGCVVNGWATGIAMAGAGKLFVKQSAVRNSTTVGIGISNAAARASVDRTRLEGNATGLSVTLGGAATVGDSVGAGQSGTAFSADGGSLELERCSVTNNGTGVGSGAGAGTVRVSDSTVTENGTGLAQTGAGIFLSRGNNTVAGNGTDVAGTVTNYGPK